jgi:hypothetical protein
MAPDSMRVRLHLRLIRVRHQIECSHGRIAQGPVGVEGGAGRRGLEVPH